jgi:hypothetical protein
MAVHVLGENLGLLAEITRYDSLRIKRKFYGTGEFEMRIHARQPGADSLEAGRVLYPTSAPEKATMIYKVAYDQAKDELTVSGRTLDGWAKQRRAVPPSESDSSFGWDRITGDAESVIKHYAQVNLAAPQDAARAIPHLELEENQHRGMESVPWQARFDALDAVLEGVCAYADIGWDIVYDPPNHRYLLRVLTGRDLTENSAVGGRVVFAAGLGNLAGSVYTQDWSAAQNVLYIGGAGEDEQRLILQATAGGESAPEGLGRYETWADAGSVDNATDLLAEAAHKLADAKQGASVAATALPHGAMAYGKDWDLGDRVTVITPRARMDARILEVQETYEATRDTQISVVFGEPAGGLIETVRGLQRQAVR